MVDDLLLFVHDGEKPQIILVNVAGGQQPLLDPVEEAVPEFTSHEDDRKGFNAMGLHESERLEELVEGSKSAGHADKGHGIFDEHHLAHEKIFKIERQVGVIVRFLFIGQTDIEPDGDSSRFIGPSVGGLHNAWPAAGDDPVSGLGQPMGNVDRQFIGIVIRFGAG